MSEKDVDSPFDELPEALVDEMLGQCEDLGERLSESFRKLSDQKERIRRSLKEKRVLRKDTEILRIHSNPTSCGVDGSYAIDRLLSTDMVAIAGVAVEGLTPPTEKRYWEKPHHFCNVLTVAHNDSTTVVTRAIMMCMELELAAKAPHDVVFLDGSLTTPFIYLNQALNKMNEVPEDLSSILTDRLGVALESYRELLVAERTDKVYGGFPKYTTRSEIMRDVLGLMEYEDRGALSFVLDAGEVVGPVTIEQPQQPWHIDKQPVELKSVIAGVISALDSLHVFYYRPYDHLPALRIEVSKSIASNTQRLAILLECLQLQCGAPGIMEPYPLYMADRMVKHLGTALPAIRKTTTQEMSLKWEETLGNMYLAMHGYRTELGK